MPVDTQPSAQRILVTGATGFVGRALVQALTGRGFSVQAWVRNPTRARSQLGPHVGLIAITEDDTALVEALGHTDAVLHLAGENVMAGRWTASRKRALYASRVDLTRRLVAAIARATARPHTLVASSAVGFYGDQGDKPLTEKAAAGSGFLGRLCQDWEQAASDATAHGLRVVNLRTGLVLGEGGGVFQALQPVFSLSLGGPLGTGNQYLPWIGIDDLVQTFLFATQNSNLAGPVNACAPNPVTSTEFAHQFGQALHRPAVLRVPSLALKTVLGERSELLLQSQRAVPAKLQAAGFEFRHPTLKSLLQHLHSARDTISIAHFNGTAPSTAAARATYLLHTRTPLPVGATEAFAFFGQAENLGLITPPFMGFQITSQPTGEIEAGAEIRYRIKLGPTTLPWRTRIPRWDPPAVFVDQQITGPYHTWWHEHRLEPQDANHCVMVDQVYYRPPLGLLGRLVHGVLIAPTLRTIFAYRQASIARLYAAHQAPTTTVPPT